MELVVATRNKDKLKEIKTLLKGLPIKVVSLANFKDVPEVKEDGRSLQANAKKKAIQVSRFLKKLAVADDSGLEVPSLGNGLGNDGSRSNRGNQEALVRVNHRSLQVVSFLDFSHKVYYCMGFREGKVEACNLREGLPG